MTKYPVKVLEDFLHAKISAADAAKELECNPQLLEWFQAAATQYGIHCGDLTREQVEKEFRRRSAKG